MTPFYEDNLPLEDLPEEPDEFWDKIREMVVGWFDEYGDD